MLLFCTAFSNSLLKMVMLLLFQSHRNQKAVSNPACLSQYNIPHIERVPTLHVSLHYFLYRYRETIMRHIVYFFLSAFSGCWHSSGCQGRYSLTPQSPQAASSWAPMLQFVQHTAFAQWDSILSAFRDILSFWKLRNKVLHYQRFDVLCFFPQLV